MEKNNSIEFKLYGRYALFSDPVTRVGGEKTSYSVPTYQAIKGICESVYWKPTIIWYVDKIRIMNEIEQESKGIRPIDFKGGNTLSMYTYLRDVEYRVKAHFEWNENRKDLEKDRNENKHYFIAKRMLDRGGRRDIFLGTRECQGYVEPCSFNEGQGFYDNEEIVNLGNMYHGITYTDEITNSAGDENIVIRFSDIKMYNGIIDFKRPEECTIIKRIHKAKMKNFSSGINFIEEDIEGSEYE